MTLKTITTRCAAVWALAFVLMSGADTAAAQDARPGPRRNLPRAGALGEGASPAEVQRLFDAYVVMEAQQALELTDEQYPKFVTRVKTLQDARRRGQMERLRVLREIRRLSQAAQVDEGALRERLKSLDLQETQTAAEVERAMEALDQVLDVRQQARFRLFEEQMEQRKVDLLLRARQANRQRIPRN